MNRKQSSRLLASLLCSAAYPALAQTATPVPHPAALQRLEEITVTARRRSENIEKVPVSITAFGATVLRERGIKTEADLQSATPGLVLRQNLSQNQLNFAIRGQSVDAFSGSAPGVLPYINEVQVSANTATSFFDLSNVQVLKGPQGTLFGRNTTGGAVLYATQKPADKLSGYLQAGIGNFDSHSVQGALNIPFLDKKVLLRISGDYERSDGYVHNVYNDSYSGGINNKVGRVSLTVKPIEGVENDLVAQFGSYGGTNAQTTLYSANACGSTNGKYTLDSAASCLYNPAFPGWAAFLAAHPGAYPGGLAAQVGYDKSLGPWTTDTDYPDRHDARAGFISNGTTWAINDGLTLKNVIGLTHSYDNDQNDLDTTSYPIFAAGTPQKPTGETFRVNQWSEEFQVQGKALADRLNYILGTYFSHEEDRSFYPLLAFDVSPVIPPTPVNYGWHTIDKTKAVFAQATYKILPKLSLTGGFRYTWENQEIIQGPGTIFYGSLNESAIFKKPSWTVGLDYQYSNALLLYVAHRGSWRAGGFNGFSPAIDTTAQDGGNFFKPETTEDIELGAKYATRLYDMPLRANIALYNQWISNVQRSIYYILNGNPLSFTGNVPKAEVTGLEFDSDIRPFDWLDVGANFSYADARYTSNAISYFGQTSFFGPYADTPRFSGSTFAQITEELPGNYGTMVFRGDIYAQSTQYFSNLNNTINPGSKLPGYLLGNLRLDWQQPFGSPVTVSGYVKNIGNRVYYQGGLPQGADLSLNNASWGRPRMYGLEVRYDF